MREFSRICERNMKMNDGKSKVMCSRYGMEVECMLY